MSLRIEKLSRRFGDFALSDISLELARGAYGVLLGPSGCGKSVLLKTLVGLFAPDDGKVVLNGCDVTEEPTERRNVGLVFQAPALFPHYSVRGNIAYGLSARRLASAERTARVDEMIAALRLEGIVDRPVATLSGGEAQRVALARALAIRPALLLLDEPLSLLDHNTRLELQAELRRLHGKYALTTLHVTHDRDEARALGDTCCILRDGTLVQSGPTADLFARPAEPFVATFLGVEPKAREGSDAT